VGEQRRGPGHSVADSKAASASHWNKLVSIPVLNRLDRAETGDEFQKGDGDDFTVE
jgi:hypothetical protein